MDDTYWYVSGKLHHASGSCTYLQTDCLEQQARRRSYDASCYFRCGYNTRFSTLESHTYNALVSRAVSLLSWIKLWAVRHAYLPHAADDASRHKHVLHGCFGCRRRVWGKGKEEKSRVAAASKKIVKRGRLLVGQSRAGQ